MPSLEGAGRFLQANAAAYGGDSHNHLKIMIFYSKMISQRRPAISGGIPKFAQRPGLIAGGSTEGMGGMA
jgi:hypothetical protein